MTLKEELEILRGEPIEVFTGDPMDIPCIETSDPEKLCKHPVVSVHMITYNHEPYIRQAIEGVMMQKTDFEFELVIGEDCSQDKTREICFEYQKRYPDKLRVLWAEVNVNKLGGNGRRTRARCRGEFIAYCEGDDYWTDPLKLQKQVDIMRRHPSVGMCFCISNVQEVDGTCHLWDGSAFTPGFMRGEDFFRVHCFGRPDCQWTGSEWFLMTQTVMLRRDVFRAVISRYDVFDWRLSMGDVTTWLGVASLSDVYYLDEVVAVYRRNRGGASIRNGDICMLDGVLVRMYYAVGFLKCEYDDALEYWKDALLIQWINKIKRLAFLGKIKKAQYVIRNRSCRRCFMNWKGIAPLLLACVGILTKVSGFLPLQVILRTHKNKGFLK